MTQDKSENLALPIILGLVLILGAGALVWYTLPQSKRPQMEPAREAATTAEETEEGETTGAEVPLPPVDLEAAIAAVQAGGCTACHTIPGIPGAVGQVGPNLANIGVDAATRREGYDAERYNPGVDHGAERLRRPGVPDRTLYCGDHAGNSTCR